MNFNPNSLLCQYQIFVKTASNGTFSPQIIQKIFQIIVFPRTVHSSALLFDLNGSEKSPYFLTKITSKTALPFTLSNIKKCHNLIKTASKNPTYSDRVFCGGEAGICISAECKNNVLETERAAGGDRVRQHRCPVRSTEIPQNDIKKPDLFGSGFLWRRSRDLYFSGV